MKLAEALIERSDLHTRIDAMQTRLLNNARVQDGEKPAEDPLALMRELDAMSARVEELIRRINLTNAETEVDGVSITAMIAHRDCLKVRISTYRRVLNEASQPARRAMRSEIKILSTINVRERQKQIDDLSKELRVTDNLIQQANWTTDLME